MNKPIRILTIDGGGTKSISEIMIIDYLEKFYRKPIHQLFDLIIGVSAGGILALHILYNDKITPSYDYYTTLEGVRNLFLSGNIFSNSIRLILKGFFYSQKEVSSLIKFIKPYKLYKNKNYINTNIRCSVVTSKFENNKWIPYLLRNYKCINNNIKGDSNWDLYDKFASIANIPVLFKPFRDKNNNIYVDGGLIQNNPSIIAIKEAKNIWPNKKIGIIVSIGCGNNKKKVINDFNLFNWCKYFLDQIFDNSEKFHEYMNEEYLDNFKKINGYKPEYFRLNPSVSEIIGIETNLLKLHNLQNETAFWLYNNLNLFQKMKKYLLFN